MKQVINAIPVVVVLLLTACSKPTTQVPEAETSSQSPAVILAKVDGEAISEDSFRVAWQRILPRDNATESRQAVLDDLIHRQSLLARAKTLGLEDDPIVRETIESALIARLKEQELQPRLAAVTVSDKEVRAIYDDDPTVFATQGQLQVALLWFNTRGQAALAERYRPRLSEIVAKVEHVPVSKGFGQLAVANTEHRPSRYRGGILPTLQLDGEYHDSWQKEIQTIAKRLTTPGQLSPIVENDAGSFLVRLITRHEATIRPFDHVRAALRERLLSERRAQAIEAFYRTVSESVRVQRFEDRLDYLTDLPTSTRTGKTVSHATEVQP